MGADDKKQVVAAEEGEDGMQARGEWGSQLEFILTIVGYAVGLGNVWRFPYLCYRNGGGAFLIPYFTMLALVGMPLFFLELAFGQFASLGPIAIWKVNPLMKGLGFCMVITNTIVALYYNVIIAWSIYYFFASMTNLLPWENCENWWNTDRCFTSDELKNVTIINDTVILPNDTFPREALKTPSEEYFYNQVLQVSDDVMDLGGIRWQLACCLALSWTIVFLVLSKGISSLGKVVYFSSIFPYVLLTVMLIRGVTLPNAVEGIEYYLSPDFERLSDAKVWSDAATQIFYSLSACTGGLIAMASFNKFNNNCLRDAIMVPLINCGTSFYAGFVIFSVLGFMAGEKGVSVDDVAESGPGLVFVVYPEGLTQMPAPPVWAVLFFFMLVTLGFSSEFSMVECFFSSIVDEFPNVLRTSRKRNMIFRAVTIFIFYLITLPMVTEGGFYLFNLVDNFIGGFPLLFVGMFESIAIAYIYGFQRFSEDIAMMLGKKPNLFFKVTWLAVSPGLLFAIIIFTSIQYAPLPNPLNENEVYPDSALALGWCIVAAPLICIPAGFFIKIFSDGGWELIKRSSAPEPTWGPANKADRTGRYKIADNEKEGTDSRKTSITSFNSYSPSSSNGKAISMTPMSGTDVMQRKSYSAGGPPVGPTSITQPPTTNEVEPLYAVPDRSSKTSTPPPVYTKIDETKQEVQPIDDPEPEVTSYNMGGSEPNSSRSAASSGSSPGKDMVTDIDAYESPNITRAQINSSSSESDSAKGVENKALEEDESKL